MPKNHLDRENRLCEPTLTPTIQPFKYFGDLTKHRRRLFVEPISGLSFFVSRNAF